MGKADPQLILASSSPYRRRLLERLHLPFLSASPDIDESALPGESARDLVLRLSRSKARALAGQFTQHIIIGSDQVAAGPDGELLGKPGNLDRARDQLRRCRGQLLTFYTGLCLYHSGQGTERSIVEQFQVRLRSLADDEIENYLTMEKPYDCAGSFRMEGLGIALFEELRGRDPNTLIGLPLIALIDELAHFGIRVLRPQTQGPSHLGRRDP